MKAFYDKVGKINGWDFSQVQVSTEDVKWDFYEEIKKVCKTSDLLLDIGTGGGENVLKIAPFLQLLVGIDLSQEMITMAQANIRKNGAGNTRFFEMSSDHLQFPNGFFDVISCRHAPFNAAEVARVLKSDGIFLTQQVSEDDKSNLKKAFGRGQSVGEEDGALKKRYLIELKDSGFTEVECLEYDAIEYYQRPEDLLFLLTHTPIIPEFGLDERDYEILSSFIERNQTEKGIQTNSKRFLIIAKK